ncbi:hypothetical protein V7S43_011131 [Phytophthora oleae]|uniref:MULE transposase domain-containing protein n=1 Tax=Phytophthora oleae TaxID=2107226 RepID=A0ABD3FDD0_9STRA
MLLTQTSDNECSPILVVDLTTGSDTSPGVDAHGIPLDVRHFPQPGCRREVWTVLHRLAAPLEISNGEMATHVCVVKAQMFMCNPYASPEEWKRALHRITHSSYARDHMHAIHLEHPICQTEITKRMEKASRQVEEALDAADRQPDLRDTKLLALTANGASCLKRGTLQNLWVPTHKQQGVYIAYWLLRAGLPYNTVASEDFRVLVQRLTGVADATILSPATFRGLLDALFVKFCQMTAALLLREYSATHHSPFLNFHLDRWTTVNRKTGVLGTSVSWIDATWTYREIALLATKLYGIDIDPMAQFTVSDTAASARKVTKRFEDSLPTDCIMHVLNLCLQYGMCMRENQQTATVYDPITSSYKKVHHYCTVGGPFKEGRKLVKRVRALNHYFSSAAMG